MNKKLIYTALLLMFLIFLPLGANEVPFAYPDVTETIPLTHAVNRPFTAGRVAEFVQQWQRGQRDDEPALMEKIDTQNQLVGTLKSISRMQTAQLDQLRRQTRPVFSIPHDPSNPLYAFRLMTAPSFSTTPPPGMVDKTSLSHQFGLNFSVAQKLPTAGSLSLALKHGLSITTEDNGPRIWKQSPSIALSFQQPLGLGGSFLDTKYGQKVEEKQIVQRDSALDTVQQTKQQVYLQALTLQGRRQALLENRWLSKQQALLADQALLDAQLDVDSGRISRNQLVSQQAAFQQSLLQIAELDREIERVDNSLASTLGELSVDLPLIDVRAIGNLAAYTGDETQLMKALQADSDYKEADRSLQLARLDKSLGNPSDAPMLSVSVQFSPYYTPTKGNGLLKSFDQLFTTSEPTVSVSVGFMANDLSRSTSKMTSILADEQILQASLRKEQARQAVTQKGADYGLRIATEFATLGLFLDDYDVAGNELEIARIRASVGLAHQTTIRQKELGVYRAAFAVLQKLRSMTLLAVELEIFTGTLRL